MIGKTPLLIALVFLTAGCEGEKISKPGFLLDRDEVFLTPMQNKAAKAVERNNVKALEKLSEQGLDVNAKNTSNFNLLYWALKTGKFKSFNKLLQLGANADQEWGEGYSVTYWAAGMEDNRFLKSAIASGANPNSLNSYLDDTPLFKTLMDDRIENFKFLVENGADINFKTSSENTPIMEAASANQYDIVNELISLGADHCIKNSDGKDLFYHLNEDKKLLDKSSKTHAAVINLLTILPNC